jgi:nicotinate-nucleotide adenylyltransferase
VSDGDRAKFGSFDLRKIGIYGGTFDPIHNAHLVLARQAREELNLEQVVFVPAAVSPFKEKPAADGQTRLRMLRAAIADEPGFSVDDSELRRPPPSYTFDSIEHFRKLFDDAEVYCLIGEDNVADLSRWHRFDELKGMVQFIVLNRTGRGPAHPYRSINRLLDISATEIRKRVASGLSIRYLVPTEVETIIREGNLYRGQKQ